MSSDGVARALWQAQHRVEQALDELLGDVGLSTTLNGTLGFIAAEPGLSAADLARRARVKPQSAAHAVNRLEQLGLIVRRPHPVHGRAMCLELTEAGRSAVARGAETSAAGEARLTDGLSAQECAELVRLLDVVGTNASKMISYRRTARGQQP
jgi:DNA-binding MarR family transcriptional regulator